MVDGGTPLHILIVGAGSVGSRHAVNLSTLGCSFSFVDPREDRRNRVLSETAAISSYETLEIAASHDFDGAVIASPTLFHAEQAKFCLRRQIPVLLEKPPAIDLASTIELQKELDPESRLLLGYTWRWWPPFQFIRRLLDEGTIGTPMHVRLSMASHLADWHPWEPYEEFFMSDASLGGGALLDESHWIDLSLWLFGPPKRVYGHVSKISNLNISADDNVDILLTYEPAPVVSIHLDLYSRPHRKEVLIVGHMGSITWDEDTNCVRIELENGSTSIHTFTCTRNEMFLAEAREFLSLIRETSAPLTCSIEDGLHVLRVIEAVRAATDSGQVQDVN